MNVRVVIDLLKMIGLFLLVDIVGILFICGLGLIVFAVFLVSITWGYIALGVALIIVALILSNEQEEV